MLTDSLNDASQAVAAWSVLENEAALMCAQRARRTKHQLLILLGGTFERGLRT